MTDKIGLILAALVLGGLLLLVALGDVSFADVDAYVALVLGALVGGGAVKLANR